MQAIILAAGMGKRLKKLTSDNTKCMVKVNGVTMIERMLSQLDKHNLNRIVMVIGYEGEKLKDYIATLNIQTPIEYVENVLYAKTNNIYSLFLAANKLVEDDTILLESDLIFEDKVLDLLFGEKLSTVALVDRYESWMDGTVVKIDEENNIKEFIPGSDFKFEDIKDYYKTVNIYKFTKVFSENYYVPFLTAYSKALGNNEYYEQVLKVITIIDNPEIKALPLPNGEKWYEIDDLQDLDIAESMFANDADKLDLLNRRYGGYWRYPKLIDFCYLVNPYFPPKRLLDEIKANVETLITQYPSGMYVNSLLAGKYFDIDIDNIVVGNGAAELIKSLMENTDGKLGVIKPTFEEYPNRYEDKIIFVPKEDGFRYDASDIMEYFDDKNISTLLLINPDNPTGNYINRADLIDLIEWAMKKSIKIVVDESFVDFADEVDATLIEQSIVDKYKDLVIIKSISKSFGIPGLRLGVLISADKDLIRFIKSDVSIWNINSLGEFYLQIAEKYKKDYVIALQLFREERRRFKDELSKINTLEVFPSDANYFLIELKGGIKSAELARKLLEDSVLIKDLSEKIKGERQFIRVAIRDEIDNDKLVAALRKYV